MLYFASLFLFFKFLIIWLPCFSIWKIICTLFWKMGRGWWGSKSITVQDFARQEVGFFLTVMKRDNSTWYLTLFLNTVITLTLLIYVCLCSKFQIKLQKWVKKMVFLIIHKLNHYVGCSNFASLFLFFKFLIIWLPCFSIWKIICTLFWKMGRGWG